MDKREVILDSGVKLLMINTDKFKTVNVTLFFEDELNDFNVTCDNLLTKLLVTKTGKHSSRKEFKSYLKELYDMKVSSIKDNPGETFCFSLNVDSLNKKYTLNNENLLEKQFEVLNEILYYPCINEGKFDDDYFREVKSEYKQVLVNNENYKEYLINKKINKILGKDNKQFVMTSGYVDELNNISNKDAYEKYLKLNSLCKKIIVCGEIDFEEVISYVHKYFSFSANRNNFNYLYKNDMKKYDDVSFDSKFSQSSIAILYDLDVYVGDELYYPTLIFIELFNYYLFKIVREEYNFCYLIYSSFMSSRGLVHLQSNIDSKNYEKTQELVNDIINDLRNNIDEKVLDICKSKVINNIKKEVDNPIKTIVRAYNKELYNLKDYEDVIKACNNVSESQVKEVANKLERKFSAILKEGKLNG